MPFPVNIPEPTVVYPLAKDLAQRFSALGKTSGIYAFASSHKITHLGWSTHLSRRLKRLLVLGESEPTALAARLHRAATEIHYWPTSSRLESSLLLYRIARAHFPNDYLTRLRLRMPWFVTLTDTSRFARLAVTDRVRGNGEPVIGPFASRGAAQQYQEELLGCFPIRRCTDPLSPDPGHPGCIYGEMNLCLRPCQCVVSADEYRAEADTVADTLLSNGKSTLHSLSLARDKAAAEMDFEEAAQIHKRVERLKAAVKSRDEVITAVNRFSGIAVTTGSAEHEFRLWPCLEGYWQEPVTIPISESSDGQSVSLDSRLRELLTPVFLNPCREGTPGENLALFARWYYSSWRDGEWIPCTQFDGPVCRKLIRSLSKMARETAAGKLAGGVLG
jgi:excinuclease ABC subunit C